MDDPIDFAVAMTEFFTVVALTEDGPTADTDVNSNSHRSVRSYKTLPVANQAIERGTKMPGVRYGVVKTTVWSDNSITSRWVQL